ncbi:hypothetical protein KDK95_20465 [Actinospica sp. MGRD01-02]|uniref:Uncharacterized protein n=1 Tax=Actinospica acidithermotolerans TaxID=2828514 RepID=A0A941EJC6_9ACTN|nr:hypothetical protein [Actinospica acidithermotolerans]MBR7828694.1 hypothetical protein [Actinospica acidithermotolerans]
MRQGMYYRRGHWVRKDRRKAKASGWVVLAVVLGVAWLLLHGTPSSAAPAPKPTTSTHTSSSPAAR